MGDRGNILVFTEPEQPGIYFYTHWRGSDVAEVVQKALAKQWRWNDPAYLARIIFDTLTEGEQGEETGFGISLAEQDNEHAIVEVDCPKQIVRIEGREWGFAEYIKATLVQV